MNAAIARAAAHTNDPARAVYAHLASAVCPESWTTLAPLLAASRTRYPRVDAALIEIAATTPTGFADLAARYDAQAGSHARKKLGQFFTPRPLASHLVRVALDARSENTPPSRTLDPACGTGVFLIEAGLAISGCDDRIDAHTAATLFGVDVDPVAVELCRLSIWIAAGAPTRLVPSLLDTIRVGNPLLGAPRDVTDPTAADAWSAAYLDPGGHLGSICESHRVLHLASAYPAAQPDSPAGFDLVVGNPPFLNELRRRSARSRAVAGLLNAKSGGALRGYADTATAFLWEGASHLADGGMLAMVQPASVLSSRDAAAVRATLAAHAPPVHVWLGRGKEFDASVNTCGIVARRARSLRPARITRTIGVPPQSGEPATVAAEDLGRGASWGPLAAPLLGIPAVRTSHERTLGDVSSATADFRDEYYGLRGHLLESAHTPSEGCPPVINAGMIDLAVCRWGDRPVKLLGEQWHAPRLRLSSIADQHLLRWAARRLVPKILVATQTRTVEVYVDEAGALLPTTPLITVVPKDPAEIWRLAAQLACPQAAAFAAAETFGAGLSLGAIRLSATQIQSMPMLLDGVHADAAATALRSAHHAADTEARAEALRAFGRCALSGSPDREQVFDWWWQNLRRGVNRRPTAQP